MKLFECLVSITAWRNVNSNYIHSCKLTQQVTQPAFNRQVFYCLRAMAANQSTVCTPTSVDMQSPPPLVLPDRLLRSAQKRSSLSSLACYRLTRSPSEQKHNSSSSHGGSVSNVIGRLYYPMHEHWSERVMEQLVYLSLQFGQQAGLLPLFCFFAHCLCLPLNRCCLLCQSAVLRSKCCSELWWE